MERSASCCPAGFIGSHVVENSRGLLAGARSDGAPRLTMRAGVRSSLGELDFGGRVNIMEGAEPVWSMQQDSSLAGRGKEISMGVADIKERLARSYLVWRLYHVIVADAVAFQRPTKYSSVYDFLGRDLGCVVDLGCGPGVFTRRLCLSGSHVCAADIDEKSLSRTIARHARERNLTALVMRVNQLPFRGASLDTVLFLEVLEHIEDDIGALREIHRTLAPSGKMVMSVPIPPGEVNEGEEWGHKREGYTFTEMKGLLEKAGFEVVRHAYAQFKFSRLAERLIRAWRKALRMPAPMFLGWVSYADLLLDSKRRQQGDYEPACLIVLARKRIVPNGCLDKVRAGKSS